MKKFALKLLALMPLLFCATEVVQLKATVDFQIKQIAPEMAYVLLVDNSSQENIGQISLMIGGTGDSLFKTTIDALEAMDTSQWPAEPTRFLPVIKAVHKKYSSTMLVMLGDLYVLPQYRNKGYAQELIKKACQFAFDQGAEAATVFLYPFEIENDAKKPLDDSPDYEDKVQQLINLYKKCGFTEERVGDKVIMCMTRSDFQNS